MLSPLSEDIVVAIIFILLALLILPVYLILIYIFLTDREFKKTSSYKLFVNLGFFDCLQLCFHWTAGVLILYPHACSYPYVCKFLGATLNSAWVGLFPATVTIAAQRLMIITRKTNSEGNFPWLLKGMLVVGWIYTGIFYLMLLTYATVTFDPEGYSWGYADDHYSNIMEQVEYLVCLPLIVISFIIYLIVIGHIVYTRVSIISIFQLKKFTSSSNTSRTNRQERSILIQSVILFANLALLLTAWHHYKLLLPDTRETVVAINCYWIVYCGLNPLLYLTMNKTIRKKFVEVFYKQKGHPLPDLIFTTTTPRISGSRR